MKNEGKKLLNLIIEHYINSNNHNGLPLSLINVDDNKIIEELILNSLIESISSFQTINPHIKTHSLNIIKNTQIENVRERRYSTVLFPTRLALSSFNGDYGEPYSKLLNEGSNNLQIVYFNIEILEIYMNNPKYSTHYNGYSGNIFVNDDYIFEADEQYEEIKRFGLAYNRGNYEKRAVGVFISDLDCESSKVQKLWECYQLKNQTEWVIAENFKINYLNGDWSSDYWVFDMLLEEMSLINRLIDNLKLPRFFTNEYSPGSNENPSGYRGILSPTLDNYYSFVSLLEKMTINNISSKMFDVNVLGISGIPSQNGASPDEKIFGSLNKLEKWLEINLKSFPINVIIEPLRRLRKERQIPAHKTIENKYDTSLYAKQNLLVFEIYHAMRYFRENLANHPLNRDVEIPEHLKLGENVVAY